MPKSYAGLASLMEETKDLYTVTYAELIGSLEAHEKKYFPDEDEENGEGAFHARFKNNEEVCYFKNGRGRPDFNRNRDTRSCFTWLIDSGCTNHMTPNEKLFKRLDTSFNVPIRVGDGTSNAEAILFWTELEKGLLK